MGASYDGLFRKAVLIGYIGWALLLLDLLLYMGTRFVRSIDAWNLLILMFIAVCATVFWGIFAIFGLALIAHDLKLKRLLEEETPVSERELKVMNSRFLKGMLLNVLFVAADLLIVYRIYKDIFEISTLDITVGV